MSDTNAYRVQPGWKKNALLDNETYLKWYTESVKNPDKFWGKHGKRIDWFKPYTKVMNASFSGKVAIKWYEDGVTNVSYNCIDRHLKKRGNQTAIIWEGDNPYDDRKITYNELYDHVCRLANVLKKHGVKKGDRVTIYMPMIPEAAYAMLACTRIGAIHSVVFGGFSPDALAGRIVDCESTFVITADEGLRGGKTVPLKDNTDKAIDIAGRQGVVVKNVLVVRRTAGKIAWFSNRDLWYHDESAAAKPDCKPENMKAEDPLFILYTSGSTGKPKGVLHTTGGYLVYAAMTHQYVFDYHDGDIYWCTADVGWVTGHSYIVYGPLANGATCVMYEGAPNHPHPGRFWEIIERHGVNILYTAPTAIRAFVKWGNQHPMKHDLTSLRLLGTVGEPINPEAWMWYHGIIGGERCPIVDTWWQTETGAIMMSPLPGAIPAKPGSCCLPLPGIEPKILREDGSEAGPNEGGLLVIARPWPGMLRTVWGDDERYQSQYFSRFPGIYFTGDGARRDEDGYFWVMGRVDDVVNVAGHRLGTAEIESALVAHRSVAEAAVVGRPDDLKGQALVAFVTLKGDVTPSKELTASLMDQVAQEIGKFARPDAIRFADGLPKTRSGKIMRRLLKELAAGGEVRGDVTTLEDIGVLARLRGDEE